MSRLTILLALPVVFGAALAAPVPKDGRLPPTPEQLRASENNLKLIGLAGHNYHDVNGSMPNNVYSKDGKPLLSWRVLLLPYLEEEKLAREFKLDEPWDSEHNKKLIARIPKVYAPIRVKAEPGQTFYRGFAGPGTVFEPKKQINLPQITDGTSNTAWVVEAGQPVVWTKPDDLPFDPKKNLPKLGGLFDGEFHVLTVDGAVHRAKKDFDPQVFKALVTRAGGEVIDPSSVFPSSVFKPSVEKK
ncbi:MAG TPA: DUF1559 domain-containing protein [Fimbriiglobus sp.]|nr:DUF1559 domain-containing protein [Fimbriiglobus sp.]